MTQEQLLKMVSHNLKYGAYVYTQLATLYDEWNGEYKIEYLYDSLPDNSLLFMVPIYSSKADGNKLTIRYLTGTRVDSTTGSIKGVYTSKTYNILIENPEGYLTKASKGDIVANRLCAFRFIKGDNDTVILLNSPLYNSVSLSHLTVINDATFYETPTVVDSNTGAKVPLAKSTELKALEKRIEKLEKRLQYGTANADTVLATADIGTIYIQVESGE